MRLHIWLILAIVLGFMMLVVWHEQARAHDWYAQRTDPQTNSRCCGIADCAPVPLWADWIQPTKDGLHVKMSILETRMINRNSQAPIDEVVLWNRVQSPPLAANANAVPALYHVCISAYPMGTLSRIFCLFAVPSL
jgi:hypothetical protein